MAITLLEPILKTQTGPDEDAQDFKAQFKGYKNGIVSFPSKNMPSFKTSKREKLTQRVIYSGEGNAFVTGVGDLTIFGNAEYGMQKFFGANKMRGFEVLANRALSLFFETDEAISIEERAALFDATYLTVLGLFEDCSWSFNDGEYRLEKKLDNEFLPPHEGKGQLVSRMDRVFSAVDRTLELASFVVGGHNGAWGRAYDMLAESFGALPLEGFPTLYETKPHLMTEGFKPFIGDPHRFKIEWQVPQQDYPITDERFRTYVYGRLNSFVTIDPASHDSISLANVVLGNTSVGIKFQNNPPRGVFLELMNQLVAEAAASGFEAIPKDDPGNPGLYMPLNKVGHLCRDLIPVVLNSNTPAARYVIGP